MKRIKSVEEFFLGLFFVRDKLHIIDDQDIDTAVFGREPLLFVADTIEKLVDERLGVDIEHFEFGFFAQDFVANCLYEVRLAETNTTIDKEGIVLRARIGRGCLAGGVGEIVAPANDIGVEGIAMVEAGLDISSRGFLDSPNFSDRGYAVIGDFFSFVTDDVMDSFRCDVVVMEGFGD